MPKFSYGLNSQADARVEALVRNEVMCCVSSMVSYILGQDDTDAPFDSQSPTNLWPDFTEWSAEQLWQWIFENITHEDQDSFLKHVQELTIKELTAWKDSYAYAELEDAEKQNIELFLQEANQYTFLEITNYLEVNDRLTLFDEVMSEAQAVVEANWQEPEVYEWWAVSNWLGETLRDLGEVIIDAYPMIWGRQCSGQAIALDSTMYEVLDSIGWEPSPEPTQPDPKVEALTTVIEAAQSHLEDWRSGIDEGVYQDPEPGDRTPEDLEKAISVLTSRAPYPYN